MRTYEIGGGGGGGGGDKGAALGGTEATDRATREAVSRPGQHKQKLVV